MGRMIVVILWWSFMVAATFIVFATLFTFVAKVVKKFKKKN